MTTEKITISRQQVGLTKEDFSKIFKVKRRGTDRPLSAEDVAAFSENTSSGKQNTVKIT